MPYWDNVLAAGAVDDEWGRFYAQQAARMSTIDGSNPLSNFDYVQTAAPAPAPAAPAAPTAGNVNPGGSATYNEMQQPGTLGQGVQNYFKPVTSGSGWSMADNAAYTDPNTGKTYTKTGGDGTGTPLQIIEFDPRTQKPGDTLKVYNPDGTFSHTFQSSQDEGTRLAMMALAAAGGMMMLPGGAFSSTFGQGTMAAQNGMELGGAAAGGGAGGGAGGLDFSQGFTDGGTAGGTMTPGTPTFDPWSTGSAGTPYTTLTSGGVIPNGTGGAVGAPGGVWPTTGAPVTPTGGVPPVAPTVPGANAVAPAAGSLIPGVSNGTLLNTGAALAGGALASQASQNAANQQAQSARDALALQKELYYDQVNRNEPFRQVGVKSINRMSDLLGVSGNTGAQGYGDLVRKFGMSDYLEDPGYSFRLSEGQKALDRASSASGRFASGRAMKDILRFGQGLASEEYGNAFNRWNTQNTNTFNRLASAAGTGQTANAQVGNAAANYGNQGANLITGAGNAQAAGTVGSANAWTNALNQGLSMYNTSNLMNRLLGGAA